jgi:hypothetical protein
MRWLDMYGRLILAALYQKRQYHFQYRDEGSVASPPVGIRSQADDNKACAGTKIFTYLLREMMIDRPNQGWAADISRRWPFGATASPGGLGELSVDMTLRLANAAALPTYPQP